MLTLFIEGKTDLADVCFLVACVLAVLGAISMVLTPPFKFAAALVALALALVALGLLVL